MDGRRLEEEEIGAILLEDPAQVCAFGGEFFLEWNSCRARDHFGIMPGSSPPGEVVCAGKRLARVDPDYPALDLDQAIKTAVDLRSDRGAVALSGGVDSALVARLAGLQCVVVGLPGSHDLQRARLAAGELDLTLHEVQIDPAQIEEALAAVLPVIPDKDPVNASIAATLFFVCRWAGDHGVERVLAGQGADELFGGYSRYLHTATLAEDARQGPGRGRALWGILLSALHGPESCGSREGHSGPAADRGWRSKEAASRCRRPAPAGCNCLVREEGHAVRQRRHEGDGEAGRQAGYKNNIRGYLREISGQ